MAAAAGWLAVDPSACTTVASRFPAQGSSASPGRHNHTVPAASVRGALPGAVVVAPVVVVANPPFPPGGDEQAVATTAKSTVVSTADRRNATVVPSPGPRCSTANGPTTRAN